MSSPDNIDRVLAFDHHWDAHLSRQLSNAEMMALYPNKNICKNQILNELINSYIRGAIERALLMFYEAVKFIRKADPSFSYQEAESDPVGLLMAYRNKLLTHREENRLSEEGRHFASLLQGGQRSIYRDIEAGVNKIKEWLDSKELGGRSSSASVHLKIKVENFEQLIQSAPELKSEDYFQ